MASSEDADINRRQTDGVGNPDTNGFDTFYDDIIQSQLDTGLLDCLVSKCNITIQEADRIRGGSGQMNRNKQLLSILRDRPYDCFGHFIEALQKSNTLLDGDLVNKMKVLKIKGGQPDVKFTDESIKIEDFQVRFQKSYQTLVEQMSSPMNVADRLLELETFNSEEYDDIYSLPTSSQKNRKILSKVASKQRSGYNSFLRAMKTSDDPRDEELVKDVENVKVTSDDGLLLQIGLSYERMDFPSDVTELIQMHLQEWQNCDEKFILTRATDYIYNKIKNRRCVTVSGNSGMGKTMVVRHVALKMQEHGYIIVPIIHPKEIVKFVKQRKILFVVDDVCGKYTLDQKYFDKLKPILKDIELILKNKGCKIISTCRLQVLKDVKFKSLAIFNECECNLKSENLNLTAEEVEQFATKYFGKQHAGQAISQIKQYDHFPFLCKLYHNKKIVNFETFCKNPFQFIGEEVDNLLLEGDEGKYKYCALVLCVIHNDQLTEKYFTGKIDKDTRDILEQVLEDCEVSRTTPLKCLHKALETLVGTFLTKDKNCYRMLHDKVFDYVSFHLGEKMINTLIEHADSAFIRERFMWDESNAGDKVDFIINLPDDAVDLYIERIITDWRKKNILDFFSNRNHKSSVFTDTVLEHLKNLDKSDQEELVSIVDDGELQNTPLVSCCYFGNLKLTQWLLQHGADVNQCRSDDVSALYMLCQEGYVDIVIELLQHKPDINKCTKDGWSPLYTACGKGYIEIVRELLQHKPDINKCNKDGWSPLNAGCLKGNIEIVRELLKYNPDINKSTDDCWSPLYTACGKGYIEIVRELLQHKPDINKCNKYGWSPLNAGCLNGDIEIVRELLQYKPDVNKCNKNGCSPLFTVCWWGHVDIVRELIQHKPDINKCDEYGWSPLNAACLNGNVVLVGELLQHKPDINKCSNHGSSPLHIACEYSNTDIVVELFKHDVMVDLYDDDGDTALYSACYTGNIETVKMLLERGVNVNKCSNTGESPLLESCVLGNIDIVGMLLHKDADINLCIHSKETYIEEIKGYRNRHSGKDRRFWTKIKNIGSKMTKEYTDGDDWIINKTAGASPLHLACFMGHDIIVNLLLDKGPIINMRTDDGTTPLFLACEIGHKNLVTLLLKRGAKASIHRQDGKTPYSIAMENGHNLLASMLLS